MTFEAIHCAKLINLLQGVYESTFEEGFVDNELMESLMNGTVLKFPILPVNSQCLKSALKLTTEASQTIYKQEARHKYIITKS